MNLHSMSDRELTKELNALNAARSERLKQENKDRRRSLEIFREMSRREGFTIPDDTKKIA